MSKYRTSEEIGVRDENGNYSIPYRNLRKFGKPQGPDAPHYMNKSERKKMVEICKKSGMKPEHVRQIYKHRVELAEAQIKPMLCKTKLNKD